MSERKSYCRGCRREILWAITEAGRRMPLDPEPVKDFGHGIQVLIHTDDGSVRCRAASPLFDDGVPLYQPHWATCPNVDDFRAPKGGAS